jgi:hypothetical protein
VRDRGGGLLLGTRSSVAQLTERRIPRRTRGTRHPPPYFATCITEPFAEKSVQYTWVASTTTTFA